MAEEVKVEAVSSSESGEETTTKATPGTATESGEAAAAGGHKVSRSEKKARKAVEKLGLKRVPGIVRVRVKKGKSVLFAIAGPEVYKSPNNETTYVIFGEAKMDQDLAGQALSEQASKFAAAGDDDIPDLVPSAAASAPAGDLDEETEKQVSVVVDQTGCTREVAIKALKETNGDVVNAILRATSA